LCITVLNILYLIF